MSQNPHIPNGYPPGYPPGFSYPQPNPAYPMAPGVYGYGYHPQPPPYYGHPPAAYGYPPTHHPHPHADLHAHPQAPPPITNSPAPIHPTFTAFTPNPEDSAQIETWFQELDKDYDGFIGGSEIVPFFQRSNLHNTALRELWNLVDYNKNGRLDRKQFIIAIRMLTVLCSPIYAGSNPTVELFNSTISKPISLPPQMFQAATVAPVPVAPNAVSSPQEDSSAEALPVSSVQDAPLPPLPPIHQPTQPSQPTTSPIIPSNNIATTAFPAAHTGYYYNTHYGYPGSTAVPTVSTQPMQPVSTPIIGDEDEFSDFNAAPVHSTTASSQVTLSMEIPATAPMVTTANVCAEADDPWKFVSTDNPPPSSKIESLIDIVKKNTTVMTATTASTTNSMLSLDLGDPTLASPVTPNSPASRVCFMAAEFGMDRLAVVGDVENNNDDFEGFQQASTTTLYVQQTPMPHLSTFIENVTQASRLAALDEIIEQDLKLANEEDWEDFEGHETSAVSQPPEIDISSINIPPTTVLPPEVLDNPFDMLDSLDEFPSYPVVSSILPADVAISTAILPVVSSVVDKNDPFAAICISQSTVNTQQILGDIVVDDVEEDEDFGDFALPTTPYVQQMEPLPEIKDSSVKVDSNLTQNIIEDDPFANAEFQMSVDSLIIKEDPDLSQIAMEDAKVIEPLQPIVDIVVEHDSQIMSSVSEGTDNVESLEQVDLPNQEPVIASSTMTHQVLSLDFLDLDFGPIADSVPLPPLAASATSMDTSAPLGQTMTTTNTSTTTNNKKIDLLDLLDNVYGVPNSSTTVPASAGAVQGEDEEEDFAPFVSGFTEDISNNAAINSAPIAISVGDENRDDDDDDDFEPFQSTPMDTVKSTDVLFSKSATMTTSFTAENVVDFDPFATGQFSGENQHDDDFFAEAAPVSTSVTTSVSQPTPPQNSFSFKSALTISDLESLVQQLAKKHLYDEAYACAKQASILRTIASLSEAKNIALEQDDLEVAQSIKLETQLWMQQLASVHMETHWQRMAHDDKRHGASLDEMYENLTFMDETLAKRFHKKFFNSPFPSSSSTSDIHSTDGHSYVRPAANNKAISLEVRMKYHALAKRSARMTMAITSSHRQHVTAWKQCLDVLQAIVSEQRSIWSSTFGKYSNLSSSDKHAMMHSTETLSTFLHPLIAICEMSLWLSATCQESLVHEEEARSLWRIAQPLLFEIDEMLQLKNKYAHMSLEDMTILAGEMSECTGQVVYCNFTLRPLRAHHVLLESNSNKRAMGEEIVHYPFEKKDKTTNISYALPIWNIWHAKLKRPFPSSDGLFM